MPVEGDLMLPLTEDWGGRQLISVYCPERAIRLTARIIATQPSKFIPLIFHAVNDRYERWQRRLRTSPKKNFFRALDDILLLVFIPRSFQPAPGLSQMESVGPLL